MPDFKDLGNLLDPRTELSEEEQAKLRALRETDKEKTFAREQGKIFQGVDKIQSGRETHSNAGQRAILKQNNIKDTED